MQPLLVASELESVFLSIAAARWATRKAAEEVSWTSRQSSNKRHLRARIKPDAYTCVCPCLSSDVCKMVTTPDTVLATGIETHDRDRSRRRWLQRLLTWLTCIVILKVTVGIVLVYRDYLPPDFRSAFLRGRQDYFWNGYHWAFYLHIVAGPLTILLGMILLSNRFRRRWPSRHRQLGRVQVALVLLLLTPSGLWMARYAETGAIAGASFAVLSVATALCIYQGWRAAVRRQFAEHRVWMRRSYVLLCSAIVLRLIGGANVVAGIGSDSAHMASAWISWVVPISVHELIRARRSARGGGNSSMRTGKARDTATEG